MSENSTLRIHTQLNPDAARPAEPVRARRRPRGERTRRSLLRRSAAQRRMKAEDRLLRNSAIACAVLLGVLAMGNIRQPWAEKAVEGIERALTMRINLDDSLGRLTFVRNLMPDSALVFMNITGGSELAAPSAGVIRHRWSALQPWMLFDGTDAPVYAAGSGTVTAVSALSDGQYGLLIDHGEGLESVYAGLSEVSVQSGDAVGKGQTLGTSGDGVYFELRNGGESIDPAERLGL